MTYRYAFTSDEDNVQIESQAELSEMAEAFKHERKMIVDDEEITGQVYESTTFFPLPGVPISVRNGLYGTVTDAEGNFTILVKNDAKALDVQFAGYGAKELVLDGRKRFVIGLTQEVP